MSWSKKRAKTRPKSKQLATSTITSKMNQQQLQQVPSQRKILTAARRTTRESMSPAPVPAQVSKNVSSGSSGNRRDTKMSLVGNDKRRNKHEKCSKNSSRGNSGRSSKDVIKTASTREKCSSSSTTSLTSSVPHVSLAKSFKIPKKDKKTVMASVSSSSATVGLPVTATKTSVTASIWNTGAKAVTSNAFNAGHGVPVTANSYCSHEPSWIPSTGTHGYPPFSSTFLTSNSSSSTSLHDNSLLVKSATMHGSANSDVLRQDLNAGSFGSDEFDMEWESTINEIKSLWPASSPSVDEAFSEDVDMEIDFAPPERLIIVPDTNIWIGYLSFIRTILETKFPPYSFPLLVIPWMVLQELDFKGKSVASGRGAIHYIHKLLTSNHPRVKGQRAADAATVDPDFQRLNADDSILQCVQQQQSSKNIVVLITNDINLKNKALVNGTLVIDTKEGVLALQNILKRTSNNNLVNFTAASITPTSITTWIPPSPSVFSMGKRKHAEPEDNFKKLKAESSPTSRPTFSEILSVVEKTLSHVITLKMKEEYGDPGWLQIIKVPPPWVMKSALQCIIKHWLAVFSEVFGRRVHVAENVLKLYNKYCSGATVEQENEVVDSIIGLFNAGEFAPSDIVRKDPQVRTCRELLLKRMNS